MPVVESPSGSGGSSGSLRGKPPARKSLPAPPSSSQGLFCRYSQDLQNNHILPVHRAFTSTGSGKCPRCSTAIDASTRDVWVLSTPPPGSGNPRDKGRPRDYRMDARFVIKSHTADGEYACVLCDKYRNADWTCRSVEALVSHLGGKHAPEEFDLDPDFERMQRGSVTSVNGKDMVLMP